MRCGCLVWRDPWRCFRSARGERAKHGIKFIRYGTTRRFVLPGQWPVAGRAFAIAAVGRTAEGRFVSRPRPGWGRIHARDEQNGASARRSQTLWPATTVCGRCSCSGCTLVELVVRCVVFSIDRATRLCWLPLAPPRPGALIPAVLWCETNDRSHRAPARPVNSVVRRHRAAANDTPPTGWGAVAVAKGEFSSNLCDFRSN